MSLLMSGGRANSGAGSRRRLTAYGPQHNGIGVYPQPTPGPFESCDSFARPRRPVNAACRGMGPEFFFLTNSASLAREERICAGCPVAAECLATAVEDPSLHGIWAGTSTAGASVSAK